MRLQVEKGSVAEAAVYSDAMEWDIAEILHSALTGCRFSQQQMQEAINGSALPENIRQDLCVLIEKQNI